MGYTNETTHYGIPLPLGSDKTTPMDYNESAQRIDLDLFNAVTNSTAGLNKANAVEESLSDTNEEVTGVKGRVTTLEGTVTTQGGASQQNSTRIEEVEDDALDMVCAVDEGTAQVATVAVEEGKYFRYNNVLYMATTNIAIGDTIVPNTNCRATNVATELENISPSGEVIDTTARQGVATNASHIGDLTTLETTAKGNLVAAINEVLNTVGGANMKCAKFGTILPTTTGAVVDISDLNLTNAEDYMVICDGVGYSQGTAQNSTIYISNKTATSFTIKAGFAAPNADNLVSYQVITFK